MWRAVTIATLVVAIVVASSGLQSALAHPPRDLSNFQNNFRCDLRTKIARPSSFRQLIHVVKTHKKLQAVGAGHSWNHLFFCPKRTDDSVGLTMTTLPQYVHVNTTEATVLVSAGVKQRRLLDYLAQYGVDEGGTGWTLPAFSWFIDQTMGGAIATDTHGSSMKWGSLSSPQQLLDIWLLVANGTVLHLNDEINPHLMRAARVHVGRLGINLFMKFRIVPQMQVRRTSVRHRPAALTHEVYEAQEEYKRTGKVPEGIDEVQLFWFVQTSVLWRSSFRKVRPRVGAFDGPGDWPDAVPHPHEEEEEILSDVVTSWRAPRRLAPNMQIHQMGLFGLTNILTTNAWENYFKNEFLENGVYSARNAYLSMTEEFREALVDENGYDQYEFAIPLETAGDCIGGLVNLVYLPFRRLDDGFRTSVLVRFVSEVDAYLSHTQGGPHVYINLEDYLFYNTMDLPGRKNESFQKVIKYLKESPKCKGSRLHWGKAGWPDNHCNNAGDDYPDTWCHFGCAVQELDPRNRFAQESNVFHWNMAKLERCCTAQGFDWSRPGCRLGCSSKFPSKAKLESKTCTYPPPHPSKRYSHLWWASGSSSRSEY